MPHGTSTPAELSESVTRILEARHHDPFEVLGRHAENGRCLVRAFLPQAERVRIPAAGVDLSRIQSTDLFEWKGDPDQIPERYQLSWRDKTGDTSTRYDPYCFPPQIPDFDLHLFGEGRHWHAHRFLGAHPHRADGVDGVRFAAWAPNAERVSLVGNFNHWDGRSHPMRVRGGSGVWELFIPDLGVGELYKLEIRDRDGSIHLKIDPYARSFQVRPRTAAYICGERVKV